MDFIKTVNEKVKLVLSVTSIVLAVIHAITAFSEKLDEIEKK